MNHTTVALQAPHGKSFSVKGKLESSHAGELLTDEEFSRLAATDVKLTRTTGGGFEYEVEFSVIDPPAEPTLDAQLSEGESPAS
jgi:hypothetical protein